jgi:hypothetical protein
MNAAMGIDQASGLASLRDDMSMGGRQFTANDFKGIGSVTYDDLAKAGRFGDKFLAHVADGEMVLPKQFLDQNPYIKDKIYSEMDAMGIKPTDFTVNGGDLTNVNPKTGMPEFGFLSKAWKSVKKVVKKAANVVLPIAATVACGGNPACGAAASAALTKAQGGSWGDALKSAAFTYAGQSFAQGMGSSLSASSGGQTLYGWDAISTGLNPINATTGAFQMPTALATGNSFGMQANVNPVQGFFQGLGGSVKAAFTPGVSMGQGFGGYTTDPVTGGIASIGGTPVPGSGPQYFGASGADISSLSPAQQAAYRDAASQAMNVGATPDAVHKIGIDAAAQVGQNANAAASSPSIFQKLGQAATTPIGGGATAPGEKPSFLSNLGMATAATVLPALLAYESAGEPVPENEMAKYDAQSRVEIEKYNQCVASGQGGCTVPRDLQPVALDINTGQAPGSLYTALQQGQTPTQGIGAMAGGAPIGGGTNVIDIYRQIAQNRQPAPIQYGVQALYKAAGGSINGPGTGTSDSIPAMLSDGEFVMTAQAVRGAGNGSRQAGVKKMYNMMRKFEGAA